MSRASDKIGKAKQPQSVSVRDANQAFSKLIVEVERGASFVVTKNNRPVARIEPMSEDSDTAARRHAAIERIEALMNEGRRSDEGWNYTGRRDDLHKRDE